AGDKAVFAGAVGLADLGQEPDGLARILLGVLLAVQVPDAEIVVPDLDDGGVHIEGQRVGDVVIGHAAVGELVGDVAPAGHLPHQAVQLLTGLVVVHLFGPVEHDQLAAGDLVQHQAAHGVVPGVGQSGGAVGGGDHLVDQPVGRQRVGQVLQQPHAVVFDDDAACARLLFQVGQVLGVQFGFVFQHPDAGAGE